MSQRKLLNKQLYRCRVMRKPRGKLGHYRRKSERDADIEMVCEKRGKGADRFMFKMSKKAYNQMMRNEQAFMAELHERMRN